MNRNRIRIIRKQMSLLFAAVLFCAFGAEASVNFTEKNTGPANCVYVAGNPELYPLESFNEATGEYEGAVTELLRNISERTGIDFIYVGASSKNRQQELGENFQAELLTAYTGETGDWCRGEETVCAFQMNGKEYSARFCFSTILPEDQYEKIVDAFYEVTGQEFCGWTVSHVMDKEQKRNTNVLTLAAILFFAAGLILFVIVFILMRKSRRTVEIEKWLDPLTGKGNKKYFLERYREMITESSRHSYYLVDYLFDIDWVNRCVGREEAEELLRTMASVFPADTDSRISCHIQGGEMADLLDAAGIESVRELTTRNLRLFNEKAKELTGANGVTVNAAVLSLSSVNCNGKNALRYVRHAVSRDETPSVTVCTEESLHELIDDSELYGQIGKALENEEFLMLIQPVYDVKSGRMKAGEVLARWDHPDRGRLKPTQFLTPVREMKLSLEFDCYMLEKTCAQLETWEKEGKTELCLACYVCLESLLRSEFIERYSEVIGKHSFDHGRLYVIITEEMLKNDQEQIAGVIRKLHKLGVHVILGSFGTGHTSLASLTELAPDLIKIERETTVLLKSEKGRKLLTGIAGLGHSAGCEVIFQGIETEEHKDDALHCGCDYIQGYYFARPMPPEEAVKRMRIEERE